MPLAATADVTALDRAIDGLFGASPAQRPAALRRIFVERLDFEPRSGDVPLHLAGAPASAQRIAVRDGVEVVLAQLPTGGRLTARELAEALKEVRRTLNEVFLVATNAGGTEWQFVYPTTRGGRDVLRRMAVQQGQPRRTVVEQLADVYARVAGGADLRAALEHAYDVEAVTDRFFREYRRIFEQVRESVAGLPDPEERRLFCQTLFNRLMFLYFLQRKGWLTFDGNPDYLNALWESYKPAPEVAWQTTDTAVSSDAGSFYTTRLRPLFFVGLSHPRSTDNETARRLLEGEIGSVPFLNGGLFAEEELDRRPGVDVPDAAIEAILRDLFARFNFTIAESTPYDVEVAVDPEMLGKVFEELVTGRHETGSYYTPRPVVSFMCREALKGYLTAQVEGLAPAIASAFVDDHQIAGMTMTQAGAVLAALERIAVVDPACGSGAYLLGMLHELVDLQKLLYNSSLIAGAKELYELKLRVIERNVYGVDIDRFAVNIAMLRLWLSLVVDYEGDNPPPLPNLDYKIACGDSLTAPNPQGTSDLIQHTAGEMAAALARLKGDYLRATGEEKRLLHDEIAERQAELRAMLTHAALPAGAVDWRVQFAEVFEHGGFDVVLANPPYLRMELFRDRKPVLRRNFPETHAERADLYVYFFQRANELLRPGGIASFISSNKWLRAGYGAPLRAYLESQAHMQLVLDFGELPVFEAATTYPAVFIWQKRPRSGSATRFANVIDLTALYAEGVTHFVERAGENLPPAQFQGQNWSLVSTSEDSIRRKMEAVGVRLGEYVEGKICWGIKTGFNEAFWIDEPTRERLIAEDSKSTEVIKPLLVGDDIRRYEVHDRGRYILYLPHGIKIDRYPAVKEHLKPFRARLESRATDQPWYELQQPQEAYVPYFESPKIVYPDIGQEPRFALDNSRAYVDATGFGIALADLYLLAILNSQSAWWYLRGTASVIQGASLRFKRQYMEALPIPTFPQEQQSVLASLVGRCVEIHAKRRSLVVEFTSTLSRYRLEVGGPSSRNPLEQPWILHDEAAFLRRIRARGDSIQSWALEMLQRVRTETAALTERGLQLERQIDQLVYELYGLTAAEIAVVESTRADVAAEGDGESATA